MNPLFMPQEDALGGLLAGMTPQQVRGLLFGLASADPANEAFSGNSVRVSQLSSNLIDRRNPYKAIPVASDRLQALFQDQGRDLRHGGMDAGGFWPSDYRYDRLSRMQDAIIGADQGPMVYPGLLTRPKDVQLRRFIEAVLGSAGQR
jgi:hypothetical protein